MRLLRPFIPVVLLAIPTLACGPAGQKEFSGGASGAAVSSAGASTASASGSSAAGALSAGASGAGGFAGDVGSGGSPGTPLSIAGARWDLDQAEHPVSQGRKRLISIGNERAAAGTKQAVHFEDPGYMTMLLRGSTSNRATTATVR